MASKRLLLYAADACRLSSLLLRRAVRTRPATLEALREGSRRVLLDQSRLSTANVAAIKLLEWDRELNLMQYHGLQEYARRWWGSKSWSLPFVSNRISGGGGGGSNRQSTSADAEAPSGNNDTKNVARVAFMITSEQRHNLSTKLGYMPQDIRSFKPIEALLLLEHGVARDSKDGGDFRTKLRELMEENDRLMSMQHREHHKQHPGQAADKEIPADRYDALETNTEQSLSPEEAQQLHVKPDVALALLSADKDAKDEHSGDYSTIEEDVDAGPTSLSKDNATPSDPIEDVNGDTSRAQTDPPPAEAPSTSAFVDVTPDESEQLHMKPDVAAAILSSQQQKVAHLEQQVIDDRDGTTGDADEDEQCWYEVIEQLPAASASKSEGGGGSGLQSGGEQVITLFPTKEEALECVRIKESFRRGKDGNDEAEGSEGERFLVRRR